MQFYVRFLCIGICKSVTVIIVSSVELNMPLLNQSSLYNSRNHNNLVSHSLDRYYCRFCKRGYKLKDELISHKKVEHGDKMKIERELEKLSERKLKIERKLEKLSQRDRRQTAMSVTGTVVTSLKENVTKEELTTDTVEDTSLDVVQNRDKNIISGAGESSERIATGEDTNYSLLEGELTKIQSKSHENGPELRPSTDMENSSISMQIGENDSEAGLELEVLLSGKNRGLSYGETNDGLKYNFCDPAGSTFSHPELSPSVDANMTILQLDMSPADLFVEKSVTTTMESKTTTSSVTNTLVEEDCDEFESWSTNKPDFDSDVEILPTPVPEEKLVEVIDLLDDSDDDIRDIENEGVPNRQQPEQRAIRDDKGSTNAETIAVAEHMDYRDIEFDTFPPEIQSKSCENCTEKQIMRNGCNSNEKVRDGTNGNEIIIIQDNISRDQHPSAFTNNTLGSISTSTVETKTISDISSSSFINVDDSPSNNLTTATTVMEATSTSVENGENGSEVALEVLLSKKDQSRSDEDDTNNDELKNNFYDTSASEFSQPQLSPSIETEAEMAILQIDKSAAYLLVEKSVRSTTTTTMVSKDDDDGDIVPQAASSNLISLINVRVTKEQEGTATIAVVKEDCDEFESSSTKSDFDSDVEILPTPVPEKKVVEVIDLLDESDSDIHDIENQSLLKKNRLPHLPGRTQNSKYRQQKEIMKHVILYRTRCCSNRSQARRRGRQQPMQKNNNINDSKGALLDCVNRAHEISEDKKYSTHLGHIMDTASQITTRFEMTPSKYGPKPAMYKCGQCRNAFSDAHLLSLHVRHAHPPGKVRVRLNSFWEMRK